MIKQKILKLEKLLNQKTSGNYFIVCKDDDNGIFRLTSIYDCLRKRNIDINPSDTIEDLHKYRINADDKSIVLKISKFIMSD